MQKRVLGFVADEIFAFGPLQLHRHVFQRYVVLELVLALTKLEDGQRAARRVSNRCARVCVCANYRFDRQPTPIKGDAFSTTMRSTFVLA